ncbi:MAG: type II toxin-antitoxin system Phd/YefM family antitoxin [Campylobacterales bacterium]|nr:type II toxin-antitoxin system Phd/YefM family antitoxin [Campylobacterales bacterium]
MLQISTSKLKQQIQLLSNIEHEEIVITKRDKPFGVVLGFERYQELLKLEQDLEKAKKLQTLKSLGSFELGGDDYKSIKSSMS